MKHEKLTKRIIGAAYAVHNAMGFGFLEKVYENALAVELRLDDLTVRQQEPIRVTYREEIVGDYVADLVVEDSVIVEVKAVSSLDSAHEVQLVNYLKATGLEVGLLINFGHTVEVKRRVFG
jgi:GxxExxY protein